MKKYLVLILLAITTSTFAQQFVIRLDKNWKADRKHSREELLEKRIHYLEQAVWELQRKIYKLESDTPIFIEPVKPSEKAWFCELEAFNDRFEAWGPTELEARSKVTSDCTKQYFRTSCSRDKVKCEANR